MSKKTKIPELRTVWREARWLVWRYRWRLLAGLGLITVGRLAGLVLPASSKVLIDQVIGQHRANLLLPLAAAVGLATLVQAVTSFSVSQTLSVTAQRAITEMRKSVEQHVMRLPVDFFDSTRSGVLISRIMTDAEGIRNLVGTGLAQLVGGMITAAASVAILFYLNVDLTFICLAILLLFAGVMAVAFRTLRPIFRERGAINAEVTGRLGEALGGVRVVKAYTAEKREDRVFASGAHRLFRNVAKAILGMATVSSVSSVIMGAVGVAMLIFGGRAVLAGKMTLGDLTSYVFFTGMVASPMIQIASIATQLSEAFAGLDRIRELRRLATEEEGDFGRDRLGSVAGRIEAEALSFEYRPGEPVLRDISFVAPAGTTTALVGPSGSGKSTLTSLIAAFRRPTSGRILIDGRDLGDLRLSDYRRLLGIVQQENFLFDGTIAENIAYGHRGASREEILSAARIAHCDPFVKEFPEGYETVVGERGVKLSGGQRQRVAIARAILADPSILILDEATSSLDSESEVLIQDGLKALRAGRTTFVIAHRLSTIRSADQILVLERGEIVERGTHRELMALQGRYRELHDKQMRVEEDRFVNPGEESGGDEEDLAEDEVAAAAPLSGLPPSP